MADRARGEARLPAALVAAAALVVCCGRPAAPGSADAGPADPKVEDAAAPEAGEAGPASGAAPTSPAGPLETLVRVEDSRRLSRPLFDRLVRDPDVLVRRRAMLALGRIGRAEGLEPLRQGLSDEDPEVRRVALFGLGRIEVSAHRDAERVIHSLLDLSPGPEDRRAAVAALGAIGTEASRGVLVEALESPDPALRAEAARALGLFAMRQRPPAPPPFAELVPRLGDDEPAVRLAAAFALSRGEPPPPSLAAAVTSGLERALREDPDPEVRVMAGRTLSRIGLGRPAPALEALERDEDWRVRTTAASALGASAPPGVRARALAAAWHRIRDEPGALLSPALHPLVALLEAAAASPHRGLARALRQVHREAAARSEGAGERERLALAELRCMAALALDRAAGRPALVLGCAPEGSGVERWELRALEARAFRGSASAEAGRRLGRLLRDEEVRVRLAAVETIETLPGLGRLALVERALGDASSHVVAAAAHALYEAAPLFEVEERPSQDLSVTEHTADGPVVHRMEEAGQRRPEVPAGRIRKALARLDADQDVEAAVNLLKAVGRLRIEAAAEAARPLASHHNPAVRREARSALAALGLEAGPEIAPDPPRLVEPSALAALAASPPARVRLETTAGPFVVELRTERAAATSSSFLGLVRRGFYDGVRFHRVVPGFVVQVGDPSGTGYGGPGYTIRCEVTDEAYGRGSVGMALAGPDTGGSQLFVTVSSQPHLDRHYTLFGQVVEGLEVVESVQSWDRIVAARVVGEAGSGPAPEPGP